MTELAVRTPHLPLLGAWSAPDVPRAFVLAAGATACIVLGAAVQPLRVIAFGAGALLLAWIVPMVGRAALGVVLLVSPWLNPPIGRSGTGRAYVVQAFLLLLFVAAGSLAARRGGWRMLVAVAGLALAYAVEVGLARGVGVGTLGWVYKPLQPFFVTAAVAIVVPRRQLSTWFSVALIGGAAGCLLAAIHSLVPAFDPFTVSRPEDLTLIARVANVTRESGAFVYPNNLGTFAAYVTIAALAIGTQLRHTVPRWIWALAGFSGVAALVFSATRAAAGALVLAAVFVVLWSPLRQKVSILISAVLVCGGILLLVSASQDWSAVVSERVTTSTGASLDLRQQSWSEAVNDLRSSSLLLGTGVQESRLDSSWHLYLSTGGILGFSMLLALAWIVWSPSIRRDSPYRRLAVPLLVAMASSALIQDTLGQTLTSWYVGALLGLCLVPLVQSSAEPVDVSASPRL